MRKYPLNSTVEKTEIFNYPFIIDSQTVSYIKENAQIMFIIRGLPYTGKTAVSRLLMDTYPNAVYCSAVKFINSLHPKDAPVLPKNIIEASMNLCLEKVEKACLQKAKVIIIQNSHVKSFEMQPFLNFAASYGYTVIMVSTIYRFDITPKALVSIHPGGLDTRYLLSRFDKWEDVVPLFTGWFISPNDSLRIHNSIWTFLEPLLEDTNFRTCFRVYNPEQLRNDFQLRKVLSCLAGYFQDSNAMKAYYFSDAVQSSYGKTFTIHIVGYLVSTSGIIGIVQVDQESKNLIPNINNTNISHVGSVLDNSNQKRKNAVEAVRNICEHGKTFQVQDIEDLSPNVSIRLQEWSNGENIDTTKSSFIHLAQRNFDLFSIPEIKNFFESSLKEKSDKYGIIPNEAFHQLKNNTKFCSLPNDVWLVKAPLKISVRTVFTGFYP